MKQRALRMARWFLVTGGIVLLTSFTVDATLSPGGISQSALGILALSVAGTEKTAGGCPAGTVTLSSETGSVCVDAYEASPSSDCPNTVIQNANETRANLDTARCAVASLPDAVPWTFVTLNQAQELCARAGKWLTTADVWYRASLGTADPSGGQMCNVRTDGPKRTGTFAECRSGVGTYDMIGNVWEWVDAEVSDGTYGGTELPEQGYVTGADRNGMVITTDPEVPHPDYHEDYVWISPDGTFGVLRGGFFGSGDDAGIFSIQAKTAPSFSGSAIGFRCAKQLSS